VRLIRETTTDMADVPDKQIKRLRALIQEAET